MAQYLNYYDHTIPNDGEETIGMSESERKQIIAERCAKVTFAANFVSSKFQKFIVQLSSIVVWIFSSDEFYPFQMDIL